MDACLAWIRRSVLACLLLPFLPTAAFSQSARTEDQRVEDPDGAIGDVFGVSVAMRRGVAAIGAHYDDSPQTNAGSVSVYRVRAGAWAHEQKLTASDANPNDNFGSSVDTDGTVVIVGASVAGFGGAFGAAYVYRYDGTQWIEEQKLLASDGVEGDRFGGAVAVRGNTAVVGAWSNNGGRGAVYVFQYENSQWLERQKLVASDRDPFAEFGTSLALGSDNLVVGAPGTSGALGAAYGAAYIFRLKHGQWYEQQKLTASDGDLFEFFGDSVSLSGSTVLISCIRDDELGIDAGAAYIFEQEGTDWVERQKLTASDGEAGDGFGSSVALHQRVAIIGDANDNSTAIEDGSAYLFRLRDGRWHEKQKLGASDAADFAGFGNAVVVRRRVGLVAAGNANAANGAVYSFTLSDR